jgi:hypothetical protein
MHKTDKMSTQGAHFVGFVWAGAQGGGGWLGGMRQVAMAMAALGTLVLPRA